MSREVLESQSDNGDGGESDGMADVVDGDVAEGEQLDDVFTTLSNQRRRFVIHRLLQEAGECDLRTLSRRVAAWEYDKQPDAVTSTERHRIHTVLHQFHLPKLDDKGLVDYDDRSGTVTATSALDDVALYLEVVPKSEISWSTYYLLLATATGLLTVVSWAGLGPFDALPLPVVAVATAVLFAGSAVVHAYVTRTRKLGSEGPPPELRA